MTDFKIRDLTSYEEFQKVVCIQKAVWKHKDVDLTPAHQFTISIKTGAILLGAFAGKDLAGFVYSFPAVFEGKCVQHSHQLAVLPEYRGRDIGKMLKWRQRKKAVKMGYDTLAWTSDPLLARNANLNLHTLGAEARIYIQDFYTGIPALSIRRGVPVDRFFTEWHLKEKKVQNRAGALFSTVDEESLPKALNSLKNCTDHRPGNVRLGLEEEAVLVEIPRDIQKRTLTTAGILEWQKAVRRVAKHYFLRNYRAVDFIFKERCFYVLKRSGKRGGP